MRLLAINGHDYVVTLKHEEMTAVIDAAAFYDLDRTEYLRYSHDEYTPEDIEVIKDNIDRLRVIEQGFTEAIS